MVAWRVARLVLAGILAAVATAAAADEARLEGRASYRERVLLPPGATLEAMLEQRGPGAVEPLARASRPAAGSPPFDFVIPYDPGAVAPDRGYRVRARITLDGRLMFASDSGEEVFGAATEPVEIVLRRVPPAAAAPGPEPSIGAHGMRLPATFAGDLPCPDCEALRWRLNLWRDQAFHLRRVWVGKDLREDRIGRWSVDPGRGVLTLDDGEEPMRLEIVGPARLRLLGADGAPAPDSELAARERMTTLEPGLTLRGMVTFVADSARVTECLTGRDYPLAAEGDRAALEHAYLAAGTEPGSPLLASFEGAIVERPEEAERWAVAVRRFLGVWPGEACARGATPAQLTGTYWRILRLGEADVAAAAGRREPHMLLRADAPRFAATVGCNQIAGSFMLDGSALRFGEAASTRMGCPEPLDGWERQLAEVLSAARAWRIDGRTLELFDANGVPLALFQAAYLP